MAAPVNKAKFTQDINAPIKAIYGGGLMFSKDNLSNVISVDIVDGGQPFEVTGTVSGTVIRSDGTTVPVDTGAISGNTVSLTLTEACFDVPGQIVVNIIVTNGDIKCCVLRAVYTVVPTETSAVVDPGEILPSIADLINDIDAAVASIPADYSGLLASIAGTFSASTAYAAGAYVWYDGTLYRFTAAHAAGSWTGSDATVVTIGGEIADLKSASVSKKGENQVTPQNLEGMQFTKTACEVEGENIFTSDMLFEEGYYVAVDPQTGNVTHGTGTSNYYNAYCIPVEQNTKYRFTTSRFVVLATGNTLGSHAIGTTQSYLSEIETGEATYLFLSIDNGTISSISDIYVKPVTVDVVYSDFVLPDWLQPDVDLSEIESRLESVESGKVDKDGTGQIKPKNIEGVTVSGGNILNDAERLYSTQTGSPSDGYVTISNGMAIIQITSNFCSFLFSVKPNTHYTANNSIRFAVLLKNLSTSGTRPVLYSTVVGSVLANITSFDTGEADHIIVSWNYNRLPIDNFIISEGNTPTAEPTITLPEWLSGGSAPSAVEKPKFAVVTGNIASGGNLQLTAPKNNLRKGERIVFEGNISSFDSIRIGLTYGTSLAESQQINYFVIDGANISYYPINTATPITVAHGLALSNNIQIIWEMSAEASVKLTLISNGNMFSHEFNFTRKTIGNPFVLSIGTVLTDCKLTWTCNDIDKDIWMFGDSYFAYSANRWTYYLHQYGYDQNCLLDGFPGEGGVNGRVAFNNLLQYGTPKYAVWCLGMNDNSDSNSAPSANWVSAIDLFLQYCTINGITPVFGTIPTVPTINHEQKNAWIRNSGYRYIDFAKAVGASASGVWYGNMLSSDGVHPSESGAKALFAQVLIDLPEIMVGGYGTPTSA